MKEIGERLKAARIEQGLSLEDIQQTLKIRLKYLQAIEDGRLEDIPGLVYARGFIRSYARLLSVDIDEDLARITTVASPLRAGAVRQEPISSQGEGTGAGEGPPPGPRPPKAPPHPIVRRQVGPAAWVVVILILALAAAVYALAHRHGPQGTSKPTTGTHVAQKKPGTEKTAPKKAKKPSAGPTLTDAGPASMTERGGAVIPGEGYDITKSPLTVTVTLNGPCWIQVLSDGVYETPGIVGTGTHTFTASSHLSVVLGAPIAVTTVSVDGQVIHPFTNDQPTAIVVTKD